MVWIFKEDLNTINQDDIASLTVLKDATLNFFMVLKLRSCDNNHKKKVQGWWNCKCYKSFGVITKGIA
jgi:hypothetical protein